MLDLATKPFKDRRVLQVWQKLLANPQLKVKTLAGSVGLSESRLTHLFSEQVGMTVRQLKSQIKLQRLHEARRRLLETFDTIAAISELAGYQEPSNFIHDFKKVFGETPGVCRRTAK